jgi:Amt family ammonium transporter
MKLQQIASELDTTWVLITAVLVMFMQAGFACVEMGFSRGKNAGAVVAKVLVNFSVASLTWWMARARSPGTRCRCSGSAC